MLLLALILRRIVLMVVTLLAVAVLTFFIVNVLPGDVAYAILGDQASPVQVEALRHELGLNRPVAERFIAWISGAITGNFGTSLTFHRPVGFMIWGRLQNSATLASICLAIIVPVSVTLGVVSAVYRGSWIDKAVTAGTTFLFALPEYVLALAAMLIFAIWLEWLPGAAMIPPGASVLKQWDVLILPVGVIVAGSSAYLSQMTRASMITELDATYVRTATLKGLPRAMVILKHALPNAMLPTLVEIGLNFGALLGGLVVIETIFNYAGIGQLMVMSVQTRDVPTLQAAVLLIAAAYCVGSLLADVASMLLNPRFRS